MQHAVCLSLLFLLFKILDLLPMSPKPGGWKSAMVLFHTSKVEFLSRDGLRFHRTNYSENMFCRRGEELLLVTLLWMKHPSTSQPQMFLRRVCVSTLSAKNIRISLQWSWPLYDTYILDYSISRVSLAKVREQETMFLAPTCFLPKLSKWAC